MRPSDANALWCKWSGEKKKSGKKINIQRKKSVSFERSSELKCRSENHEDIEFSSSEAENIDLSDNPKIEFQDEGTNLEMYSFAKHGKTFKYVSDVLEDATKIND